MRNVARPFAVLISLGWIAAWAGALVLMWRPGLEGRIDLTDFNAVGDITTGGTARLLATLAGLAAIALALPVLAAALLPQRTRTVEPAAERGPDAAPHDHATRTAPVAAAPRIRADVPEERVHDQPERPASLRTEPVYDAAETPAVPRTEPAVPAVPQPAPVTATHDDDLAALRARMDRQDEELRRLREALHRRDAGMTGNDEREQVTNGRV